MRKFGLILLVCFGFANVSKANTITFEDIALLTTNGGPLVAPYPDIFASSVSLDYDATTDLLQIDANAGLGSGLTLRTGNNVQETVWDAAFQSGSWDLDATVDSAGNLIGGTFTILGGVHPLFGLPGGVGGDTPGGFNWHSSPPPFGAASSTPLLTGTLTAMVFDPSVSGGSNDLYFFYDVTGGVGAVSNFANGSIGFGPAGSGGFIAFHGVPNNQQLLPATQWTQSFSANGIADIGVPTPSSMSMLASLGIASLAVRRRRKMSR